MASDKETRDILAYLNDTLPSQRRVAFEAKMQADPDLQKRVAEFQKLDDSLEQFSTLHQLRQAKQEGITQEQEMPVRTILYRVAASIAIILITSLSVYRFYIYPTQSLYNDFYSPDTGARGGAQNCPDGLKPIRQLYESKAYEQALAEINQMPDSTVACVQYQKGLLLLAVSEPEKAALSFNQSIKSEVPMIRQMSEWYLSLAYLKNRDKALARTLLQKINNEPNHPKRQAARQVLIRLGS